jgi:hypothetical protein
MEKNKIAGHIFYFLSTIPFIFFNSTLLLIRLTILAMADVIAAAAEMIVIMVESMYFQVLNGYSL